MPTFHSRAAASSVERHGQRCISVRWISVAGTTLASLCIGTMKAPVHSELANKHERRVDTVLYLGVDRQGHVALPRLRVTRIRPDGVHDATHVAPEMRPSLPPTVSTARSADNRYSATSPSDGTDPAYRAATSASARGRLHTRTCLMAPLK